MVDNTIDPPGSKPGRPKDYIVPGVEVAFGAVKRIVPPLNLGALRQLQKRLQNVKGYDEESIDTAIDAVHAALKRNYVGIDRAFVEEHLDTSNMFPILDALMNVSGLERKGLNGSGKTLAVEQNLTGASSTAT